jgi:hypothetical protein
MKSKSFTKSKNEGKPALRIRIILFLIGILVSYLFFSNWDKIEKLITQLF